MSDEIVKYSIPAPNGLTYSITGPAGASEDEVRAEVLRQHPEAGGEPAKGPALTPDVPPVMANRQQSQQPQPIEETRSMGDVGKAAYEIPLALASGALAGPIAGAYGVYKGVTGGNYGTDKGTQEGAQAANELYQKLQYEPTSPVTGDVLGKVGEVANALKIPPMPVTSGATLPSYAAALRASKPFVREGAREAGIVARAVGENGLPSVKNMSDALRKKDIPNVKKTAPTTEFLDAESTKYFDLAKGSGVELDPNVFNNKVKEIKTDLRQYGYDADAMPKVGVAIKQMEDMQTAKDYQELKTLRRFIANAQRSKESDERMVATELKSQFDDFIANMPDDAVIGGDKIGLDYWKKGRDAYSKLSKSELFDNMLERAPLHATKYSQSGEENFLAGELRKLADNPKQMRLFTPEEQQYIREAAEGGRFQNALRMMGKYSPKSVVATLGGIAAGGYYGGVPGSLVVPAVGAASHVGATAIRKNDISKISALMRAGKKAKEE